jgi:DMSO/TMAO reductase YedYZ molybdopterin-dependent catalytic subunit
VSDWLTCWPIVVLVLRLSTFGLTVRIPANSAVFPVDAFVKDLPIARIRADVLISYELNGSILPAEHGFPARLVVPGFYGTNSVKWLTRIKFSKSRAPGPFTTRWYNDPVLDSTGRKTGGTTPVWSVAPESLIVSPLPDEPIRRSIEQEIWGWGMGRWRSSQRPCSYWRHRKMATRRA